MKKHSKFAEIIHSASKHISLQNLAIVGVIVVLCVVMQIMFPLFLTKLNIETMAMAFVFEGIIALGMTFVIITGGIDLSVCAVLPFAEIVCAKLMTQAHFPIWISILLTLIIGGIIGLLNGTLIHLLNIHPMIITMAMMLILRGVNLSITDGRAIADFSKEFLNLGQGKLLGIYIPILVFIILSVILSIMLNNHPFFRQIYFIGNNEKAATLSGVNVPKVKTIVYMLCSTLAAIAGVLAAAKYGAAHSVHGNGAEVKAISAVAIGGASLYGGSGKIISTVIGIIFLTVINNAFVMSGMNTFWFDVVNGGMLIIAIMFSYLANTQNAKRVLKVRNQKLMSEHDN